MSPSGPCLFLVLLLSALVSAQAPCGFDDGFADVPAGITATLALPQIPAVTISGSYAAFHDCAVAQTHAVTVHLGAPVVGLQCDEFDIALSVVDPAATPAVSMAGALFAKYARTFRVTSTASGEEQQLWRFVVVGQVQWTDIGDVMGVSNPGATNAIPSCYLGAASEPGFPFTVFYGHVDYTCEIVEGNPGSETWSAALSLTHHVGCIAHANSPVNGQALAPSSTIRHPHRSFHLVGPAPFDFSSTPPPVAVPSSIGPGDAVRSSVTTSVSLSQCVGEAPLVHAVLPVARDSLGMGRPAPPRYYHMDMPEVGNVVGAGPGPSFVTFGAGCLPTGFVQQFIGRWPAGQHPLFASWRLWSDVGMLGYTDAINPATAHTMHVVHGVTTEHSGLTNIPELFTGATYRLLTDVVNTVDPATDLPVYGTASSAYLVWMMGS